MSLQFPVYKDDHLTCGYLTQKRGFEARLFITVPVRHMVTANNHFTVAQTSPRQVYTVDVVSIQTVVSRLPSADAREVHGILM